MENLKIYDLTVNYLKNPCGIDSTPRFSFKAQSGVRGDRLSHFTLTVSGNSDLSLPLWQRNFGAENDSVLIKYEGDALTPVTRYYFSVEAESESRHICHGQARRTLERQMDNSRFHPQGRQRFCGALSAQNF